MEGFPTVREISATGLQVINFNQIFRPNKLSDQRQYSSSPSVPSTWAGVTSIVPSPAASPVIVKNGLAKKPTPSSTPKPKWQPEPRGFDPQLNVNQAVSTLAHEHY
jgi:hypothetical protein